MRATLLVAALLPAAAISSVLQRRDVVVEVEVITITSTIYVEDEPTPAPGSPQETACTTPEPTPAPPPSTPQSPPPLSQPPPRTSGGANPGYGAPASGYQDVVLRHHDVHRYNHSAPALAWDDTLASYAQQVAQTCVFAHDLSPGGGNYGQNIAAGFSANEIHRVISDQFYNNEVELYNGLYGEAQPDQSNFHNWGHFTQVVWKSTAKVGCYTQDCSSSKLGIPYTVCNYGPAGNFQNEYGQNVGQPLGRPPVNDRI